MTVTTFPDPHPALERAQHPRSATLPRELRPTQPRSTLGGVVHEDPAANPNPSGPQPAERSTLPASAGGIERIAGKQPGAPGLAPDPTKT